VCSTYLCLHHLEYEAVLPPNNNFTEVRAGGRAVDVNGARRSVLIRKMV